MSNDTQALSINILLVQTPNISIFVIMENIPDLSQFDRVIMGVDPGTNITGYGMIGIHGKSVCLLAYGVIDMGKLGNDHALKLHRIFERVLSLIDEFKPDELSIESPFFGKNVQSMLKLGRAQGVAMAAAMYRQVPIFEYAPKKVKMAITGNGNASKEQVCRMLEQYLKFTSDQQYLDATDGLALAVTHYFQAAKGNKKAGVKPVAKKKGARGAWTDFANKNPGRVS